MTSILFYCSQNRILSIPVVLRVGILWQSFPLRLTRNRKCLLLAHRSTQSHQKGSMPGQREHRRLQIRMLKRNLHHLLPGLLLLVISKRNHPPTTRAITRSILIRPCSSVPRRASRTRRSRPPRNRRSRTLRCHRSTRLCSRSWCRRLLNRTIRTRRFGRPAVAVIEIPSQQQNQ